jgi:hypothetical protein
LRPAYQVVVYGYRPDDRRVFRDESLEGVLIQAQQYRSQHPGRTSQTSVECILHESEFDLRAREAELHRGDEWFPLWDVLWAGNEANWRGLESPAEFSRGFVESIICTWPDWLAHHKQILAQTPLKNVELTTRPELTYQPNRNADYDCYFIAGIDHRVMASSVVGGSESSTISQLLKAEWPRLKFTLPPPLVTVDFSGARTITLPPGWVVRGAMPTYVEIDEAQRMFQSSTIARSSMPHYLYYGDGPTPSVATAPPAPPADPSSDDGNI